MPTTRLGLRYPSSTNSPNVPQDIQNLASDVDSKIYPTTGPSRTTLSINAGWHAAVGYGTPCIYLDASGLYHLGGMISNDNAFSGASNAICSLPAHPTHTSFWTIPVNMGAAGVTAQFQIDLNGVCSITRTPAVDANLLWDLSVVAFHTSI